MSSDQTEPQQRPRPPSRHRRLTRFTLLALAPVVAILVGGYYYAIGGRYVSTENAYVKTDKVAISTDIDGRVIKVSVVDNQLVDLGDLLFSLDPEPYRIELSETESQLRQVRSEVEALRASLRQQRQELNKAEIDITYWRREFERQKQLIKKGHASKSKYDLALHDLELAQQQANSIREEINEVIANLNGHPDAPSELHPRYMEAKARRDEAELNLRRAEIGAPIAGIVTRMTLQPGEYVEEGTPVFSIVQVHHPWVEANLKETDLANVRVGQAATITVDAYPGALWNATIQSISPATGAEFSLLPPQNATGNWVKVVQRIPVKLVIDQPQPNGVPPLRAGMSVEVRIDTLHEREMPSFVKSSVGWVKNGTE